MKRSIFAAMLLAASTGFATAQSPAPDPHHPSQSAPAAASVATPMDSGTSQMPANSDAQKSSSPMNMMGGNMPMMNMMGGGGSMMNMMDMMMEMHGARMGMIDHVEGRIAFLRTELKITDLQASAFNAFADALRLNAKRLAELRASSSQASASKPAANLVSRLEFQEGRLSARLDGIRAIKPAVGNLYAALSDEQKKTADELLPAQIGLGSMMNAPMQRMGQMSGRGPRNETQSGQMQMMHGTMRH